MRAHKCPGARMHIYALVLWVVWIREERDEFRVELARRRCPRCPPCSARNYTRSIWLARAGLHSWNEFVMPALSDATRCPTLTWRGCRSACSLQCNACSLHRSIPELCISEVHFSQQPQNREESVFLIRPL